MLSRPLEEENCRDMSHMEHELLSTLVQLHRRRCRLVALLEVALGGAALDDVGHVLLVIEDLHHLRACIGDAVGDDFAALHVALREQMTD